jgi:CRISPR-associated protein Csm3
MEFSQPTRLVVRDVALDLASDRGRAFWANVHAEGLPYGEFKTEVAIDRVTSQASPRTVERVPAGALFGPAELVFGLYEPGDYARLKVVLEAIQLVEDDYLGGYGSRGSGKVRFHDVALTARAREDYGTIHNLGTYDTAQGALEAFDDLQARLSRAIPISGAADAS